MNTPVWDPNSPRTSALAGQIIAEKFAGWSPEIRQEFADNAHNHQVGSVLLSETDEVKVWSIRLAPGERLHRYLVLGGDGAGSGPGTGSGIGSGYGTGIGSGFGTVCVSGSTS